MIDGDGGGSYDTIGVIETTLGKIMGAKSQQFYGELKNQSKNGGQIIVKGESIQDSNQVL